MIFERAKVPDCGECRASCYANNPPEEARLLLSEDCPKCSRGKKLCDEPEALRIMGLVALQDAGAPLGHGRYDLNQADWLMIGAVKTEREKLNAPQMPEGWQKVPER